MCVRCEVRFFVRLYKIDAGILAYVKEILCKITENLQADDVQSFQRSLCGVALILRINLQDLIGTSIADIVRSRRTGLCGAAPKDKRNKRI